MSERYQINGGLNAFPVGDDPMCVGLTKREYFAGKAMQALITSAEAEAGAKLIAFESVKMADLLLWQLEQKP